MSTGGTPLVLSATTGAFAANAGAGGFGSAGTIGGLNGKQGASGVILPITIPNLPFQFLE